MDLAGSVKPRLLDLFSGAGGCARGYQRAGFYVVGVDIIAQPRYAGDEFHRGDALDVLRHLLDGEAWHGYRLRPFVGTHDNERIDVIHASPPCKRFTVAGRVHAAVRPTLFEPHEDLLSPARALLAESGLPYVIENVPGAPMHEPVVYCGSAFGLRVRRHRLFESNVALVGSGCRHDLQPGVVGVYGNGGAWTRTAPGGGGVKVVGEDAADALGIDWTTYQPELAQAIPPAYTEHIGGYLLAEVRARQAAAA